MSLGEAEDLLFVAEVDLDIPAGDIGSKSCFRVECGIGANEESRAAIEQFGCLRRSIRKRSDNDESERHRRTSGSPKEGTNGLVPELVDPPGSVDVGREPGQRLVFEGVTW